MIQSKQYDANLLKAFDVLSSESKELYLGVSVTELPSPANAFDFHRNFVSRNVPVVIRNAAKHWPAVEKWNEQFFRTLLSDKEVTVAVTPNGYADGLAFRKEKDSNDVIVETEYFVMPEERKIIMRDFLDGLDNKSGEVMYIQRQNSNFIEDFPELRLDVPFDVRWASEAFDKKPDAVNFWMGDERAITSMHKDPYENIYAVISGYKDFILIPPTDMQYVPRKRYPVGTYSSKNGTFEIIPMENDVTNIERPPNIETAVNTNKKLFEKCNENSLQDRDFATVPSKPHDPRSISWVCIDPLAPDLTRYDLYKYCNIYNVRVNAGDLLYLPSLWYHHVRQSHKCIAVNYWYDMDYDSKYCYYKMVESLCGYDN